MPEVKIEELIIYPIKGCRGVSVDKIEVTSMGLVNDREYALLHDGKLINQKQVPLLVKLTAVYQDKNTLRLSFPGKEPLVLSTEAFDPPARHDNSAEDLDHVTGGKAVSEWLSDALGGPFELIKMTKPISWHLPLEEFANIHQQEQSKFVDAAPLLLTNLNSLLDLNTRLSDAIPMNRFRANIVLSGLPAYEEDKLSQFRFSNANLKRVTVCERCIVTTTDQESGERTKEPLRTLSQYRKRDNHYAGGILFGMYLCAESSGILSVGDTLH